VRSVDDTPQVFILPLDGGEAWQLTSFEHGVGFPRWSPDGTRILFGTDLPHHVIAKDAGDGDAVPAWDYERPGRRPGDVANWADEKAKKPKADPDGSIQEIREWLEKNAAAADPRVITRLDLQGETDLQPEIIYGHFYAVAVEAKAKPVLLTPGFFPFNSADWTRDGRIVLSGAMDRKQHPDRVRDLDLFVVSADGKGLRTLLDLPGHAVFSPLVSPDGASVAFLAQDLEDPGYASTVLGVVPLRGGEARLLTREFDRDPDGMVWARDGRSLYFTAAANGGFPLYRQPAGGGAVTRLTPPDAGVRTFDVGPAGLAYVLTETANPYELYAAGADGASPRRLSAHNREWLAGKRLSLPEARRLNRPDGTAVEYWLMKPAAFAARKRYPLLVEMHGGPAAMWGPGEDTMWLEFQLFAARGYGIVYANPRGSGGYGLAFRRANYQNWGEGPGGDVLAAATEAAKEPWVDPDRQVLTGGSYAGYLTAWIVGHDHRFKAAVAQRGVYDLTGFLGQANAWRLVPWHMGGYPWEPEAREVIVREQPLSYVDRVRTPLLIIHGDVDLRTGVGQSETLYKALKILGKPVEYVRYPGASHELSRSGDPHDRMDRLLRILEFMERYVGGRR
jgi:dipeptidyl aminopeptidase/acylaminoacyl peptidase